MVATMFIRNVAYLDFALVRGDGYPIGGSYVLDIEVDSDLSAEEQNEICFTYNTIQQFVNLHLTHPDHGYDHRLWYLDSLSGGVLLSNTSLLTPVFDCNLPVGSIRHITTSTRHSSVDEMFQESFQELLMAEADATFQGQISAIRIKAHPLTQSRSDCQVAVRFVHGQRDSVCYGPQNMIHGHYGSVEWNHTREFRKDCNDCQAAVQELISAILQLDHAVWINRRDILEHDEQEMILTVGFESNRGSSRATYQVDRCKVLSLDYEPTIENVARWFVETHGDILRRAHVESIFFNEGVRQGATIKVHG